MKSRGGLLVLVLAGALAASAAAAPLGRLFFSREERAALDRQRRAQASPADVGGATMRLDGIVARRGGSATVWINGTPRHDGADDTADLRVGESLDMATRAKRDVVVPGAVRIGHGQTGP